MCSRLPEYRAVEEIVVGIERDRIGMCGGIEKAEGNPVLLLAYAFPS